jgi:hypothetical protein
MKLRETERASWRLTLKSGPQTMLAASRVCVGLGEPVHSRLANLSVDQPVAFLASVSASLDLAQMQRESAVSIPKGNGLVNIQSAS